MTPLPDRPPERSPDTRLRDAIALGVATLAFGIALALRGRIDPWVSTAAAAVLALALAGWALGRARITQLFAISVPGAVFASGLGVALVVVTHVVYGLVPIELRDETRSLYATIDGGIPRPVLALITFGVVVAEELVWRGVALELVKRQPRWVAGAAAVGLYVLPQLVGGAWLLVLAAIGLGSLLTLLRQLTGRITEPLLTHAIWSVSIFVVYPLA